MFIVIGAALMALVILSLGLLFLLFPVSFDIRMDVQRIFMTPEPLHPFGTDHLGRDLLSCVAAGLGMSLGIAFCAVFLSASCGSLLGAWAGLRGGPAEHIVMRIADVIIALPGLLTVIIFAAFFSGDTSALILFFALTGWPSFARIVRAETLKYRNKEFILAARGYNASTARIILRHMAPLAAPFILIQAFMDIVGVLLAEAGLNCFGLGADPSFPAMGLLLEAGMDYMHRTPRLIWISGIYLAAVLIALQLTGEGLTRKFNR